MKTDQHATNGIVHVVDRVITAITNDVNSLLETEDELETLRVKTQISFTTFMPNKLHSDDIENKL